MMLAETVDHLGRAMQRDFRLLILALWVCTVTLVAIILGTRR